MQKIAADQLFYSDSQQNLEVQYLEDIECEEKKRNLNHKDNDYANENEGALKYTSIDPPNNVKKEPHNQSQHSPSIVKSKARQHQQNQKNIAHSLQVKCPNTKYMHRSNNYRVIRRIGRKNNQQILLARRFNILSEKINRDSQGKISTENVPFFFFGSFKDVFSEYIGQNYNEYCDKAKSVLDKNDNGKQTCSGMEIEEVEEGLQGKVDPQPSLSNNNCQRNLESNAKKFQRPHKYSLNNNSFQKKKPSSQFIKKQYIGDENKYQFDKQKKKMKYFDGSQKKIEKNNFLEQLSANNVQTQFGKMQDKRKILQGIQKLNEIHAHREQYFEKNRDSQSAHNPKQQKQKHSDRSSSSLQGKQNTVKLQNSLYSENEKIEDEQEKSFASRPSNQKVKRLQILNRYHSNPFEDNEEDPCQLWKQLMAEPLKELDKDRNVNPLDFPFVNSLVSQLTKKEEPYFAKRQYVFREDQVGVEELLNKFQGSGGKVFADEKIKKERENLEEEEEFQTERPLEDFIKYEQPYESHPFEDSLVFKNPPNLDEDLFNFQITSNVMDNELLGQEYFSTMERYYEPVEQIIDPDSFGLGDRGFY